ncbi:MAG: ankyrin repeat domain-containing protein [Bacteroidota bacterium]
MFKRLRKYLDKTKVIREVGSFDEAGLICAVEEGNLPCLEILINAGMNVNARSERGVPALSRAIDKDHLQGLRLLIQSGGDIDQKSSSGNSPLMHAIDHGNKHIFAYLLDLQPELEIPDKKGETALFRAIRAGNTTFARKLIETGSDCESRNREGITPLMLAVDQERIGIVKALLSAGVDPRVKDRKGQSVLDRHHVSPRITKMLKKAAHSHAQEQEHPTPSSPLPSDSLLPAYLLSQSSKFGSMAIGLIDGVLQALNAQDTVDEWEQRGKLLIEKVLKQALKQTPDSLSQQAPASSVPADQLHPAFWEAISHGSVPLTQLCLRLGADPAAPTPDGQRSLHLALPHPEVLKLLLATGMSPGLTNKQGKTAAELAEKQNLAEALTLLQTSS